MLRRLTARLAAACLAHPQLVIGVVVVAVWGHSVGFGFVWDDYFFVEANAAIRSLRSIPRMFTALDAQAAYAHGFMVFRPLRTVHYALLCSLGGGEPRAWLFHAANLAWHAAAAMLVHAVCLRLFRRFGSGDSQPEDRRCRTAALWAGVAFAVHPVTSEAVCWVKGLDDLMAAVMVLLATRWLLDRRGGWASGIAVATAFTAALYAKESAVPWVVVAVLLLWMVPPRQSLRRSLLLALPLVMLTLAALLHRHLVLGRTGQTDPLSGSRLQTLIDMLPTVPIVARLVVGIPPFRVDYSYLTGGHALFSLPVLAGAVLLMLALGVIAWLGRHPRGGVAGIGGAWFVLFMLPVSNLVPMMQYMAERFLYLPLVGLVLMAASLRRCLPVGPLGNGVALLVLVLWGWTARERSQVWRDDLSLFLDAKVSAPTMARVDHNLMTAVLGLPHMQDVFAMTPRHDQRPVIGLAPLEVRAGADWPRVLETLRELGRILPGSVAVLEAVGVGHALAGYPREAVLWFELALQQAPDRPELWRNLVQALRDVGDEAGVREAVKKAAEFGVAF